MIYVVFLLYLRVASLSCTEGINYITHNPDCLYLLKRINRPSGINSKDFFEKNGILVLHFSNADIQRNLRGVCDYIDRTVKQRVE